MNTSSSTPISFGGCQTVTGRSHPKTHFSSHTPHQSPLPPSSANAPDAIRVGRFDGRFDGSLKSHPLTAADDMPTSVEVLRLVVA
jgi:hypothetical protein